MYECIGPGSGLLLSRECLSHVTTYIPTFVRTLESMLCRGSNIRVEVIGGTRTTPVLTSVQYYMLMIRWLLETRSSSMRAVDDVTMNDVTQLLLIPTSYNRLSYHQINDDC